MATHAERRAIQLAKLKPGNNSKSTTAQDVFDAIDLNSEDIQVIDDALGGPLAAKAQIDANEAAITQLQTDLAAAQAAGATDTELAAIQAQIDALEAAEAAELPTLATAAELATKADQTALDAEIASTDAEQTAQDAAIALRELLSNKQTILRATGTADDTAYASEKAVRDALDALNFGGVYVGSSATIAGFPVGANGDWAILSADDGGDVAGLYVTDGTTYSLAKSIPDFAALTALQAVSLPGAAEYTEFGLISAERLDEWGMSRRVERIFADDAPLDYTALGYADRTAIFIRNPSGVNGKGITYGAGGAVTLEVTQADGQKGPVVGLDEYTLQPSEFSVFEKIDAANAKLVIMSGERVSYFDDYADAAVKAPTRVAHDGLAVIRDRGEIWGRRTTINSVAFPANGVPNDDWFKIISQDPQSLLLNYINVEMRSAGTNAGSNVAVQFVDIDGNTYPDGDWVYSADMTQYSGGTATILTDKAQWTGTMGIGRNKAGAVKFFYVGKMPNGLSAINATPANGGSTQGVQVSYLGTNYFDDFANVAAVSGPLYWTTSQTVESSDQAAPFLAATEYASGSVFSAPEPDNTDPDYQTWFNWHVNDGETIADTEVPNGNEAELLAIKPKLTRFGVGTVTDDTVVRFPGNNGAQINSFENHYWSDETVGAMPAPEIGKEFATGVSSAASTDSEAVKNAAKVTLTHYRWVDNGGTDPVAIATESSSDPLLTGPAIERDVIQANRGSIMSFGDLQFRVPSSGNSSLQMRVTSGSVTIQEFTTHWSHQQGGASEEGFGFTLNTSWRYYRTQGLTLTQHNNFQEAQFICNGWLYHVMVIVGGSWQNNRFAFTRWRLDGVKGDAGTNGTDGVDAASIDHISLTAGDSSPGTTDTYTLWADVGETVNLGTYDVPIPAAPTGLTTVDLASYDGAHTNGRTFTLAGGRTWQDVLDEFTFVHVLVGGNSLFAHDQVRQFDVKDLTVQSRDMAVTGYQTHGSNAYHYKLRCPALNQTTVTIDNDGSSMSVQRIRLRGVK